mmetsp:Transcript_7012/g.12638  ORF Transcript_7012/g.12638 Transcript_7012/m.12638 type:complete len:154 (+) Transcript_7012:368-829(+)
MKRQFVDVYDYSPTLLTDKDDMSTRRKYQMPLLPSRIFIYESSTPSTGATPTTLPRVEMIPPEEMELDMIAAHTAGGEESLALSRNASLQGAGIWIMVRCTMKESYVDYRYKYGHIQRYELEFDDESVVSVFFDGEDLYDTTLQNKMIYRISR